MITLTKNKFFSRSRTLNSIDEAQLDLKSAEITKTTTRILKKLNTETKHRRTDRKTHNLIARSKTTSSFLPEGKGTSFVQCVQKFVAGSEI